MNSVPTVLLLASVGLVILGKVDLNLVCKEVEGRLDGASFALLRLARRRLPPELRERLHDETWLPELHHIITREDAKPITRLLQGLGYAGSILLGAREVRHAAEMPSRATAPVDTTVPVDEGNLDEALRRAQSEVNALQVQISPHFFYTALNAIATLVRTDPPRARELLMDFAGFARYSVRSATEFTTLADELENVDRYLALEKARLDERLRVTIQVFPQMYPVMLPFLALQLVVEKAVRGSVELRPGGGTVAISAVADGGDCLITVSTDGGEMLSSNDDLRDLNGRLRSAFGDAYGLVIAVDSSTVTLRVPQARKVDPLS